MQSSVYSNVRCFPLMEMGDSKNAMSFIRGDGEEFVPFFYDAAYFDKHG